MPIGAMMAPASSGCLCWPSGCVDRYWALGPVILRFPFTILQLPRAPNGPQHLEMNRGAEGMGLPLKKQSCPTPFRLSCPRANEAVEHLKCRQSERRYAVCIKHTMDFGDQVLKKRMQNISLKFGYGLHVEMLFLDTLVQ